MDSDGCEGYRIQLIIGCTWLGYNSPHTIVDGLDLRDVGDVTCMMTNALDALTE